MQLPVSPQWQIPYTNYPQVPATAAQEGLSIKEKILYSALGLAIAGGAYFLVRRAIIKGRAKNEQGKTMEDGHAATYAKQIKMAFENDGWWGTDKEALRAAVREIPSKSVFRQVMVSYKKLYNSSLLADMQDELKSTEYNELLYIVSAKPETAKEITAGITPAQISGWAKRLKTAFDIYYGPFPGTDEEAIKAVFLEIPTQAIYQQVATDYRRQFGTELDADLHSELESWEYGPMMKIITDKPKKLNYGNE